MAEFSDYIVHVDESGDHSLTSIDPQFPVFSLSFCVVRKDDYTGTVVPAVQALKFKYRGHDAVVLHEHEIRKSKGEFTFLLTDKALRDAFYDDLNQVIVDAPIAIIASVIDKWPLWGGRQGGPTGLHGACAPQVCGRVWAHRGGHRQRHDQADRRALRCRRGSRRQIP